MRYWFHNKSKQTVHLTNKTSGFYHALLPMGALRIDLDEPHAHTEIGPVDAKLFEIAGSDEIEVTFVDKTEEPVWGDPDAEWKGRDDAH